MIEICRRDQLRELRVRLRCLRFDQLDRNLADQFFRQVDPAGCHLVRVFMVHEYAMMRPVAPHYRVVLYAKMRGQTNPYVQPLDIPLTTWDALPGLTKAQKRKLGLAELRRQGVAR